MSQNYDNWERLVRVVLRREHDRELALSHSRDYTSISSISSSSGFDSDESVVPPQKSRAIPMDYSDLTLDHREWKAMLPHGKRELLYKSASMRFFLDRTQKNCFLLGADALEASMWNWEMTVHPKSRFSAVAVPISSSNLDISSRINMQMLSPYTLYGAFILFGLANNTEIANNNAFPCCSGNSSVRVLYGVQHLSSYEEIQRWKIEFGLSEDRGDGWKEIQLGRFYVDEGVKGEIEVEVEMADPNCPWLKDLVVEGMEFRPLESPSRLAREQEENCDNLLYEENMESWCFEKGR